MAKKKRQRKTPASFRKPKKVYDPGSRSAPRRFQVGYIEAQQAMREENWQEALKILNQVDHQYPNQPAILTELVNTYMELQDWPRFQMALERLIAVDPRNAEAFLNLAGSYLETMRPFLALQMFEKFLDRWPDHEKARHVRKTIAELKASIPELFEDLRMEDTPEHRWLATELEKLQVYLAQGRTQLIQRTAQGMLQKYPEFAPAYNNLSLGHWIEGDLDKAIATAKKVLTFEPDNVHALSNLVNFLSLAGREEEARSHAEHLLESPEPAADKLTKQMEALTFLQDYEMVLALFEKLKKQPEFKFVPAMPVHLAAAAAAHLGREREAQKLWRKALKIDPYFDLAAANLNDLRQPLAQRNGPWSHPLSHWIGQKAYQDIAQLMQSSAAEDYDERAIPRLMQRHPELKERISILLKRGDPGGTALAVVIARTIKTADMLEALRDFVLSKRGPDELRMEIARFLAAEGVLPTGNLRMYLQGEWRDDIMFLGFQIGDESEEMEDLPPHIAELSRQAALALREHNWRKAETLLRRALDQQPDSPSLLNNLAVAYELRGEQEKAIALTEEIHEKNPNYLFARVSLAILALHEDNDTERAQELLDPLLQRKKLHFSEFEKLAGAMIELMLAEGQREGAEQWLSMLEQISPEYHNLYRYQTMVRGPQRLSGLFNLQD